MGIDFKSAHHTHTHTHTHTPHTHHTHTYTHTHPLYEVMDVITKLNVVIILQQSCVYIYLSLSQIIMVVYLKLIQCYVSIIF